MDVQLYVYDLSRGLARQFSGAFLGTQIDAVYHTAVVVGGIEYFFGAGIQQTRPGMTHHGQPMEIIPMGTTELDMDTVRDYMQSLRSVYTPESYDLFLHNCNNFSNDLCQFLVGQGIPSKITSLPQTVLNTPFGQMLKPQLDQAMRGITQAPVPDQAVADTYSTKPLQASTNGSSTATQLWKVHNPTTLVQLDSLLAAASSTCAVIFFTSRTCPPCKLCYPIYDSLAAEFRDKVTLIKVDISVAFDIASRYQIRVTPTFMSFLKGEKIEEWKGADAGALEQKTRGLVQMAFPPHPHLQWNLPTLQKSYTKPVLYSKVPPLHKLLTQLGDAASDPAIAALGDFAQRRFSPSNVGVVAIPDMTAVSAAVQSWLPKLEPGKLFALVDLLRVAVIDPRVSGFLAEEQVSTSLFLRILEHITGDEEFPYSAHITTVQAACNLFSSDLYPPKLLTDELLIEPLVSLIAISLLDEAHATLRISAASLAFNVASWNHRRRLEQRDDLLSGSMQLELAAALIEAISRENSADASRGLILALGLLAYCAPDNGELKGVLSALDAGLIVGAKKLGNDQELVDEVKRVVS